MSPQLSWLLCCLAWLAVAAARAETIRWFSVAANINLTSAGIPMSGAFNFELGVFSGSFVPSAANTAQWAANWVPAQRVTYYAPNLRFAAQFTVVSNTAPFTEGKPAYVWGFQAGGAASEWILCRNSAWTWPASNPMDPVGLDWDVAAATALIGTVHADGNPFLMQAAAVTDGASPATSWTQWRAAELAGESLNGPADDPDHDRVTNLLEFVFGTPPKLAGAQTATPLEIVTLGGQHYLQITIPRRIDHAATLTVQVSSDLTIWDSGPAATVTVSNTPAALVVRDLTACGSQPRFMRLQAALVTP